MSSKNRWHSRGSCGAPKGEDCFFIRGNGRLAAQSIDTIPRGGGVFMSLVLVTGATGFMGQHVIRALRRSGFSLRAVSRKSHSLFPVDVEQFLLGDLREPVDWSGPLEGVSYVVHVAGRAHRLREDAQDPLDEFRKVNTDATVRLAKAASEAGVKRFVFISSIGVNGSETRGEAFTASDTPRPHSPYAVSKLEAEQGLQEVARGSKMDIVILRPPLILGEDPKGNLALIHKALRRGLPLPFGMVRGNRRSFISATRLSAIVAACLFDDRAANAIFTVADPKPVSTRGFIRAEAERLGVKARLISVPPVLLNLGLRLFGRREIAAQLTGDLEVDGGPGNAILADYQKRQREV